jgi:uncharacterized iron-regulated membrane protein
MRPTFHRVIFWVHLITGLATGLIILSMAVSGLLIAYETQIMDWVGRGLRAEQPAPGSARLGTEELLRRVREARPGFVAGGVTWKADSEAPVTLTAGRDEICHADPFSGRLLGDKAVGWHDFFHAVTDWHRFLAQTGLERTAGKAVTGAGTLLFGVLLLSGIYLWWPRHWRLSNLRAALLFNLRLKGRARDWNWHNVVGFWSAVPMLLIILTGLVMSYSWANNLLFRLAGSEPPPPRGGPPGLSAPRGERQEGGGRERGRRPEGLAQKSGAPALPPPNLEGLDELLAEAQSRYPDWRSMSLRMPQSPGGPLPLMIDCGGRGQPHLRTMLNIDLAARKLLPNEDDFSRLNLGRRLRMLARWLHTGELFGAAGQTVAMLATLAAILLVWTGFALAWRRFSGGRAAGG